MWNVLTPHLVIPFILNSRLTKTGLAQRTWQLATITSQSRLTTFLQNPYEHLNSTQYKNSYKLNKVYSAIATFCFSPGSPLQKKKNNL